MTLIVSTGKLGRNLPASLLLAGVISLGCHGAMEDGAGPKEKTKTTASVEEGGEGVPAGEPTKCPEDDQTCEKDPGGGGAKDGPICATSEDCRPPNANMDCVAAYWCDADNHCRTSFRDCSRPASCDDGNSTTVDYCNAGACRHETDCSQFSDPTVQCENLIGGECKTNVGCGFTSPILLCQSQFGTVSTFACRADNKVNGFVCRRDSPTACRKDSVCVNGACTYTTTIYPTGNQPFWPAGTNCCKTTGQGSCNATGQCSRSPDQVPSYDLPVTFELTDAALNKLVWKQFHTSGCVVGGVPCSSYVSPGISGSVSACVPDPGRAPDEIARCLARNGTSSIGCGEDGDTWCHRQMVAYNASIEQPKIFFDAGAVKTHLAISLTSSTHPQYNRTFSVDPTISLPSGSVSTLALYRSLVNLQAEINRELVRLGAITERLRRQIIAHLSEEIPIGGVVPLKLELFRDDLLKFPSFSQARWATQNELGIREYTHMMGDVTISWSVANHTLSLVVTPRINHCIHSG